MPEGGARPLTWLSGYPDCLWVLRFQSPAMMCDIVAATLAACVSLADPDDPRTAPVDYRLAHALPAWLASQQEWEGSVNRHQPPPS
jgi:hypothetical protein